MRSKWRSRIKLFVYVALVLAGLLSLYVAQHRSESNLRAFQVRKCHTDNATRQAQRVILTSIVSVIVTFSDRTKAGLRPVPLDTLTRLQAALRDLPYPDFDCDGIPDVPPRHGR